MKYQIVEEHEADTDKPVWFALDDRGLTICCSTKSPEACEEKLLAHLNAPKSKVIKEIVV